jgi:hypothetical protein
MRLPASVRIGLHRLAFGRVAIEDPEMIALPKLGSWFLMRLNRGLHQGNCLQMLLVASLVIQIIEESARDRTALPHFLTYGEVTFF